MNTLTPAQMLTALEECLAHCKPRHTPQHPETGCYCQPCVDRDSALEQRAEDRADERAGMWASGRDGDYAASAYYGRA